MRIYTRGGDEGETGLFGGARVGKSSPRIQAYGEIDELNSVLGWCASATEGETAEQLRRVQSHLFTMGSWLATPADVSEGTRSHLPQWPEGATAELEAEIDGWDDLLEPLKAFILPGGCEFASRLHVARSVCRRAERAVGALQDVEQGAVSPEHFAYLNRLSDWLFTHARYVNRVAAVDDVPWR
ncbi:MAG: cob(I)yrinic acid a,c-diamide adenosyltransferase [Planctomycetota bacterium]|jgi:cob(I)alamin adenosyltransferase